MSLSLLAAAARAPERPALLGAVGTLTFTELAARVRTAMRWLHRRGLGPSETTPVGLVGEAKRDAIVLLWALVEMGVPVAMVHPRSTRAERRRFLSEVGAEVCLEAHGLHGAVGEEVPEDPPADDERPLAIVQTSGSSGRPRGVVLSRRAFRAAAAASAANLGWQDDDRWLLSLPIAHVGGLSILTRCLLARRPVVVPPWERFEAATVAHFLEEAEITLMSLVPTMLRRLLELESWQPPRHLRAMLLGGAAAPPGLLRRAADRGWPVLTTYGLTEACSQVATQRYGTVNRGAMGCGEPVEGMEVRIVDGGIRIRGRSLMNGYLPSPEDSSFDADGWFATGDLGRLDASGRLHVLGRRDEVIVTGGENVHPLEVEAALEEHPEIDAACVFGVSDERWGQAVAAALVARQPTADREILEHLAGRLAAFKRPRRIAYLDELPRTASGKLDRRRATRLAGPQLRRFPDRRSHGGPRSYSE